MNELGRLSPAVRLKAMVSLTTDPTDPVIVCIRAGGPR